MESPRSPRENPRSGLKSLPGWSLWKLSVARFSLTWLRNDIFWYEHENCRFSSDAVIVFFGYQRAVITFDKDIFKGGPTISYNRISQEKWVTFVSFTTFSFLNLQKFKKLTNSAHFFLVLCIGRVHIGRGCVRLYLIFDLENTNLSSFRNLSTSLNSRILFSHGLV